MEVTEGFQVEATIFGEESLLVLPDGQEIDLATGYIPLLVDFTFEDKAAKGWRKSKAEDKPKPPVYFSAVEVVRDHKILLLSGPSGSGKTSFAKHLAFMLATRGSIETLALQRNEVGDDHDEKWEVDGFLPYYFVVDEKEGLNPVIRTISRLLEFCKAKPEMPEPKFLVIIDKLEKAGDGGPNLLAELLVMIKALDNIKLVLLGDASHVKQWALSSDVARFDLLPLLEAQRRQAVSSLTGALSPQVATAIGAAAAIPAYFALALEASHRGEQAEELLNTWLDTVAPGKEVFDLLVTQTSDCLGHKSIRGVQPRLSSSTPIKNPALFCNAVQYLLAARHFVNLPCERAIELFHESPLRSEPILRSLLIRLHAAGKQAILVEALMSGSGASSQLGALLVSEFVGDSEKLREQILIQMLAIIEESELPAFTREKAGRVLSRLGDTRDLTALANIPAGNFILGSNNHPNSQPSEKISVESFRIGLYPVVNRDFSTFVHETGREWLCPDGFSPEKQNAPATDLTWYDAMAYCEWLTRRWRLSGKIRPDEHVRLPTEPEWERAARGDQTVSNKIDPIYPWGTEWKDDAANYEESGFNMRCSVGLFPKGRSPYGCYDMAGQVWEWCTTLWGETMTTPSFRYPWCNDGREALDAPGSIRRVLRGGCFSSGRLKICCTYRGSLEAGGFWRGNGFRIVVAPHV